MHRKRPKRPIITKNYALQGFQLVIPEMFSNFVKVSFYKHSTNISNDMTKKLILAAAMLLTGSAAVAAQPKVISHRGYWTAPNSAQNSLASFTKADSVGVFGSEIDVWLTADDKLIVNHDRVYKGTDINMEKSTLKEITSIVLPQRREHSDARRLPAFGSHQAQYAPDPRNEVAFGPQARGSRN